jgi:L-threonine kinase
MAGVLAAATVPATVGEWVQGWIGGRESLVSLVVEWKGSVELCVPCANGVWRTAGPKALRAFASAKEIFSKEEEGASFPEDGFINVINPHPVARGLATSTMDIAGTFAACAAFTGETISDERLFSLCAEIEPSDGIMFDGLARVDHIKGELIERLPPPPNMLMVAVIPERTLDTSEYRCNGELLGYASTHSGEHERAYGMLKEGLLHGDSALVARAATLSSEVHQSVVPKPEWNLLREAGALSGAIGISAAHSGTASGLLFDQGNGFGADLAERWLAGAFADSGEVVAIRRTSVCGGGFFARAMNR